VGIEAPAEFSSFLVSNYSALVGYGVTLTADFGKAEDLVQSSLVKTLRHWSQLDDTANAAAYTRTVMARAAWRAAKRRWRGEVPTSDVPDSIDDERGFGDVENSAVVRGALARLGQEQRVVLSLRFYEGLTEAETAERLGCAVGTVKSRTSRALASLRAMHLLEDMTVEPEGGTR
jgi:RNA polymerase sigma-70 factor (sigma-E family)